MDPESLHQFHYHCYQNDLAGIQQYVQLGYPVNSHVDSSFGKEYSGYTPLHFAVMHTNKEAVVYLLKKGADITEQSDNSWTPVHLAYYTSDNVAAFSKVFWIFEHSRVNTYMHAVDGTGLSHFHICCALNVPVIDTFIRSEAKVNGSVSLLADNNGGFTPLHFAVQNGHSSAARLLLANGANLRMKCGRGFTPLHVACERSDSSMVELLLTNDDNLMALTTKDNEGLVPLHVACKKSDLSVVELLLTFDADLNTLKSKDNRGRTALHYAAEQGSINIVELLLENGASIHAPSKENETPFGLAVKARRYDVFDAMASVVSQSNLKTEPSVIISFAASFSLDDFHDACRKGNFNDIKRFLNHGFSVNSHAHSMVDKESFGYTPLHFAVEMERKDIVLLLLENGADITEKNDYGCTPVHLAYRKRLDSLIFHMFEHCKTNAFVNVADETGLSHFHICCIINAPITTRNFIVTGVDVNCMTSSGVDHGFTPLHFAVDKNFPPIVELLLQNGADHSLKCANGLTPLHLACELNNVSIAKLLVNYGADFMAKDSMNRLPLHCVFYKAPDSSLVTFLIEIIPSDDNYADFQRLSLLHIACFCREPDIVKKLLDQGCSPNSRVLLNPKYNQLTFAEGGLFSGVTPLHIALYVGDVEITKHLLLAGADINALDERGHSALSYIYGERRRYGQSVPSLIGYASEIDVVIANHVKKLQIAGLRISASVTEELASRGELIYTERRRLTEKRIDNRMCEMELDEMQRRRVTERADNVELNLRSILGKSEAEMCGLVKNEEVAAFLNPARLDDLEKEFPLYGFMVKSQVNMGLRRDAMIRKAKASLNCLTGFDNLPDLCSELIFKHLRTDDHFDNLIDANVQQ